MELPLVLIVLNTELSEFQTAQHLVENKAIYFSASKLDSDSDKVSNLYHYMSKVVKRELRSSTPDISYNSVSAPVKTQPIASPKPPELTPKQTPQ